MGFNQCVHGTIKEGNRLLFSFFHSEFHMNIVSMNNRNNGMTEIQHRILRFVMGVILLTSMLFLAREAAEYVDSSHVETEEVCVVLDAGHGGSDPGKVGINGALEKEINLQIAQKVKQFLEADDIRVIMTRETDEGLYDAGASNKKVQDMKRRIALIEEKHPVITVSIHQNSYHEEYVKGSQVFYYTGSQAGKTLAELIQNRMIELADPENKRVPKENSSYYLLKKTDIPIVIVECGFLSNREEAEKLAGEEYQNKIAWSIHLGIIQYMNSISATK